MEIPSGFYGRDKEIQALRQQEGKGLSTITVVYGRRRVGKTELIRQAFKGSHFYSFEGVENQSQQEQIASFIFQLDYQTKRTQRRPHKIKTWREAFSELVPLIKKEKKVVILLDELQWLAAYRSKLISELKMVWDQYLSRSGQVTLILCGSIASFMLHKVVHSKALYGRADLIIHLKPFTIAQTKQILADRSHEEILLAHMIVGGIPKYLNLLKDEDSIFLAIEKLAFRESGYFYDEFDRIFVSHFGRYDKYQHIINLLANHSYGLSRKEIMSKTPSSAGGELTRVLENLESSGFIQVFVPFDKKKLSYTRRYVITDPFTRFYFAFLKPFKELTAPKENHFLTAVLPSNHFRSWLGQAFEFFCLNHCHLIAKMLGFSAVQYGVGPYFKQGPKGKLSGVQIDLLFDRADKVITLCEVKYQTAPIDQNTTVETQKKIDRVPQLRKANVQKVLITKSKPTKPLSNSGFFSKTILADQMVDLAEKYEEM